jgi:hypothetical protein
MIRQWLWVLFLGMGWSVLAGPDDGQVAVHSRAGGQFVIHGQRQGMGTDLKTVSGPSGGLVLMDPALVVVSCDRIKQSLLRELDMRDHWRGKIHIYINPRRLRSTSVDIQSTFYVDGWQCRIDVPSEMEASRFIRGIVHALLLELANRNPPNFTSEVPLWLSEGLTQILLNTEGNRLVLEPKTRTIRTEVRSDQLASVRVKLLSSTALGFGELSLPGPDLVSSPRWPQFENSACWFVYQLLQLPNGRAALADFISRLAVCLNWQTAFFQSFNFAFGQPLDVEKWWLLCVVDATSRDKWFSFTRTLCLDKLREILQVPVQVRHAADVLPVYSQVSLQEFVEQWRFEVQSSILFNKLTQLEILRLNAPEDLRRLISDYHAAISTYLSNRLGGDQSAHRGPVPLPPQIVVPKLVQQLTDLDLQCQFLRQTSARTSVPGPTN